MGEGGEGGKGFLQGGVGGRARYNDVTGGFGGGGGAWGWSGGEEEEEGTLGEVVVKPFRIPVAVEVGRSVLETTNIMIVVTTLQVMVR